MDIGDLVLIPQLPKRRTYLVGEVTSGYTHLSPYPPSGPHRRSVRWLGEFDRDAVSPEGVGTLGAIQTIFRPTKVEAELRNLLTDLRPWAGTTAPMPRRAEDDLSDPSRPSPPPSAPASAPRSDQVPPATSATLVSQPAEVPLRVDVLLSGRGRATITCDHPALVMQQVPRHVDPESDWRDVPGVYVLTGTELQQTTTRTGPERTLTMTSIVRPWAGLLYE